MRILFAIDLDEPKTVVQTVEKFADRLDAELMVLHVDTPVEQITQSTVEPLAGAGTADPYAMYDPSTQARIEEAREHAFYTYIYSHFTVPIRPALREGTPAETIIQDARKYEADIIALGKRHHPVLENLLLGSVSQKVVEKTDIPTLLIPISEHESSDTEENKT